MSRPARQRPIVELLAELGCPDTEQQLRAHIEANRLVAPVDASILRIAAQLVSAQAGGARPTLADIASILSARFKGRLVPTLAVRLDALFSLLKWSAKVRLLASRTDMLPLIYQVAAGAELVEMDGALRFVVAAFVHQVERVRSAPSR